MATPPQKLRRKTLILDQTKIDRAKRLLGAATDTEAITRALDAVSDLASFRIEADAALDGLVGKGGFEDHFPATHQAGVRHNLADFEVIGRVMPVKASPPWPSVPSPPSS
jgi:hypothetical protein